MDQLIDNLFKSLKEKGWMLSTAESCTGGMIAARITDVAGSSAYFDRGYVTYSNAAKSQLLSVPADMIDEHGAVSPQVAEAMAKGVLEHADAQIAIATTGIAGPAGGSPAKPVGLVYIAVATWDGVQVEEHRFSGDRAAVRAQATARAIELAADIAARPEAAA